MATNTKYQQLNIVPLFRPRCLQILTVTPGNFLYTKGTTMDETSIEMIRSN